MPSREAKFQVAASPEELWRFLRDFEALCGCIPGVERIHVLDARSAELRVKEKVGVVPLVVDLRAEIVEETPPLRLHAVAKGEHLTMQIDVALAGSAEGTELTSVFDVTGTGPLKPIVNRLFDKRSAERTAQFAEALARRFSRSRPPSS
jgi:carbon monoxide dehydrogenase subunit G